MRWVLLSFLFFFAILDADGSCQEPSPLHRGTPGARLHWCSCFILLQCLLRYFLLQWGFPTLFLFPIALSSFTFILQIFSPLVIAFRKVVFFPGY